MEVTPAPTTGGVEVKGPTKDRAIKELMALKEAYFPIGKTPGGKQLRIHKVGGTSLVRVQWADGGILPPELSGKWTNAALAQEDINTYLKKVWSVALGE